MTETGWLGLAGILATLIASLLPQWLQRKAEERRWYAQFFLERKVAAVENLQSHIIAHMNRLSYYRIHRTETSEECEAKLHGPFLTLLEVSVRASTYLNPAANTSLRLYTDAIRHFQNRLYDALDEGTSTNRWKTNEAVDAWKELDNLAEDLRSYIDRALNPLIISKLEKSIR
jgi:hypothetical protein